jgi:ribulose-phosphate 3-epimerase
VSLKISPSILSADFGHLADSVSAVEDGGADLIHVDVMDGRFVPNLTIGIPIVQALKRIARVPLDVHLMIVEPEQHIEAFANAGAAMLSVHFEASPQLSDALKTIKRLGLKAGVALNPSTPPTVLAPFSDLLDYVLVMSVNPGFSGQKFIPESSAKVQAVRAILDETGSPAAIEIDGGIQAGNAAEVVEAGADILVAASAIFNSQNPTAATRRLREAALSVSPN